MPQFVAKGEVKPAAEDDTGDNNAAASDSEDARMSLYDQMERHREQVERDYHAKFEQLNQTYKLSDEQVNKVLAKRRRDADDARKDAEYAARKMSKAPLGKRITVSKRSRKVDNNGHARPTASPEENKTPLIDKPNTSDTKQGATSLVGDYSSDSELLQTARFVQSPVQMMLMQTRTKMKTHKAAAKRFIKTGTGIKRKQAGRNHGNGGFSANTLHHLDGFVKISNRGQHLKKIGRYL